MSKPATRKEIDGPALDLEAVRHAIEETLPEHAKGVHADPIQGNSDVLVRQMEQQHPGEDITVLTLSIRLRRTAMLIDETYQEECEKAGLKLNEMLLLAALRRVGPPYALRPTDILKMHSVTSGTVTYRIDQLTKQELAERIQDPDDRRGYQVKLTPRGLETIDTVSQRLLETYRVLLRPMADIPEALPLFEQSLRLYERCLTRA